MTQHTLQYALIALLVGSGSLSVQAASTTLDEQATPPAVTGDVFGDHTGGTLGAGVTYAARYPGAEGWQFLPAPVLAVQRGILFADTLRGMGLQYQSSSKFYVSESLYYDLGRLDRDNSWRPGSVRLAGMGDVPAAATTRTMVAQQLTQWLLASAETETALRVTARRNRYRIGVEFTPLNTGADTISIDIDAW